MSDEWMERRPLVLDREFTVDTVSQPLRMWMAGDDGVLTEIDVTVLPVTLKPGNYWVQPAIEG